MEITGTDSDGELAGAPPGLGHPTKNHRPPSIVAPPKDKSARWGPVTRILARLEKHGGSYDARIVRRLEKRQRSRNASWVCCGEIEHGFRVMPVDKKVRGEYALDKSDLAKDASAQ